ncbi:MAG TPA: ATP-binding protein [Candidatus Saccharimonadales bacterium]|nr:ATP-binding protein [Candidatus Saccharimonadales bacterium]
MTGAPVHLHESPRTTRLVWYLASVGLGAGAITLVFVTLALANLRAARQRHHASVDQFRALTEQLTLAHSEARRESESLLNEQPAGTVLSNWPAAITGALQRIRQSIPNEFAVASARGFDASLAGLVEQRDRAGDWNRRQAALRVELARSLDKVRGLLREMGAAVTSAQGRHKLQLAAYLRGWQKAEEEGVTPAPALPDLLARLNPSRDLTEVQAEVAALSLLCEQLAQEDDGDQLFNLKDNLFSPSLLRLTADLNNADEDDSAFLAAIGRPFTLLQQELFGAGFRFDSAHQTITPGVGGQYNLCRQRLGLEAERLALRQQGLERSDAFHLRQAALEEAASLWTSQLASAVERVLAETRKNAVCVGLAAAAVFILLARRIAAALQRQITTIQETNAALQLEAAQRREAEAHERQAKDAAERANTQLQAALVEAEKLTHEAQAASRAKSDFLATMSHEIRTPLNGVIGFAELLRDTPLNDEQADFARTIHTSSQALLVIINDVLDFSKIEAGRVTLESIPFDLSEIVTDVANLFSPAAEQKALDLACSYTDDAPRRFLGDPGRVRQILLNLVGNAVKFTSQGHILISVRRPEAAPVDASAPDVVVTITDTGIGIPKEKQALLFQKFTQADSSTTRRFGGTGLGLAISKRLVELMGGGMQLVSEAGQGAAFSFTLALRPDSRTLPADGLPSNPPPLRLLLAESRPATQTVLQGQLQSWGLAPVVVLNASQALAEARAALAAGRPFQAALIGDLRGDVNAEELARSFRAEAAFSGLTLVRIAPGGRRDGASPAPPGFDGCLNKPLVRVPALREMLRRCLELRPAAAPPLREMAPPPAPPRATGAQPASPTIAPATRRILIAEDTLTNQRLVSYLLARCGFQADLASTGREAVELARQHRYALILMDCQMPEMDGFQATAAIRTEASAREGSDAPRIPIVALTANAVSGDREACLAAGMDDYLAKPVQVEDLKRVLARWVPSDVVRAA